MRQKKQKYSFIVISFTKRLVSFFNIIINNIPNKTFFKLYHWAQPVPQINFNFLFFYFFHFSVCRTSRRWTTGTCTTPRPTTRAHLTSFHWKGNWGTGMSHINFVGRYGEEGGGGKRPAEGTNVMILHNSFSVVSSKSNFFQKKNSIN